jgi:hypothetical protein
MTTEPIKSQQDHKTYKRLKLDNGLDVLLIHDPEMEASSSAHSDAPMTSDDEHQGTGSDASSLQVEFTIPLGGRHIHCQV